VGEPAPRRQPKRASRAARGTASGTDAEPGATDDDENSFGNAAIPVTPRPRPRPRATYRGARRVTQPSPPPDDEADKLPGTPDVFTTPLASKKHPRSEDGEPEEDGMGEEGPLGDEASAVGSPSAEPSASQTTQAGEFQIRRKRIRH